jgi:peptidoglycan/LPS O-acetylase OafA/YrhL
MVNFFKKVSWLRLLVGLVIAFATAFILSNLLHHIKGKLFEYFFETGRVEFTNGDDLQAWVDRFNYSPYWLPIHMINAAIAAAVSTFYLVKKAKGVEFENGLALGAINSLLIYQLNPLLSCICIGVSAYISYREKSSREP